MKQLLEFIIKELVEQPDAVSIEIFRDESIARIELKVAGPDAKRIIGKDGSVIKALKTLAFTVAQPAVKDIEIDLLQQ
jgi:predicted RNA-binding protein YlqC (UPF0109 family)